MIAKDWLRIRGLGRETLAALLAEDLSGQGYTVTRREEPSATLLQMSFRRKHPSIPNGLEHLSFRILPTASGSTLRWEGPGNIPAGDRPAADRFARELQTRMELRIRTTTHGIAQILGRDTTGIPWLSPGKSTPASEQAHL